MPQDKLAPVETQALDTRKLNPVVVSGANPSSEDLLQARSDVQRNPDLQEMFRKSKAEGWSRDQLLDKVATRLHQLWDGQGNAAEAALYLADEYEQLGEGIHLVSTETGRVSVVLSEEDIYTPPMTVRENPLTGETSLAQPLDRIRPEIESAIVSWHHDAARERAVLQKLAQQGHQTALLREVGDPRLLPATRRGRQHIVESFGRLDPKLLLEAAGGTSAAFLACFELESEPLASHSGLKHMTGTVESRSRMGVQDSTTLNLHHNRAGVMAAALVQGWVRQIAQQVSLVCKEWEALPLLDRIPDGVWVMPPEFVRSFRERYPRAQVLPVEGAVPILILGKLGYLRVPKEFQARNFEAFDRWEALTRLDYEMWLDVQNIRVFSMVGQEPTVQVL